MKSSLSHPASSTIQPEIGLSEVIQLRQELVSTREKLVKAEKKLRTEFDDAAKYIRRMLPPPLTGREMIDWKFQPATHIGGDGLGYRRIVGVRDSGAKGLYPGRYFKIDSHSKFLVILSEIRCRLRRNYDCVRQFKDCGQQVLLD